MKIYLSIIQFHKTGEKQNFQLVAALQHEARHDMQQLTTLMI